MNQNCTNNNFTSTISPVLNSTLPNNLTFQDVVTNPLFYGSTIIFVVFVLCVLSFIIILKNKPRVLFSTHF